MKNTDRPEDELRQEILAELQEKFNIRDEITFNEFNIHEKLKNHAFNYLRYQDNLDKAKYDLEKMNELKDKIVGEQYHYYRFNGEENLSKVEIEKYYLTKDPKVLKINKLIRLQQLKVEFFAICVRSLDKMGWNMKNYIEANKSI